MLQLLPLCIVFAPTLMWALTGLLVAETVPKTLTNRKIAILYAHPDDEVMFFGPTIMGLSNPHLNNSLQLVCMSVGDAEGLGATRREEMKHSAQMLNLEGNLTVFDRPSEFPDSMDIEWNPIALAELLETTLKDVDTIITFDDQGVSNHTNHKSCFSAAAYWKSIDSVGRSVWALETVPVVRKFTFWLDAHVGKFLLKPDAAQLVNTQKQYARVKQVMLQCHKSQMVWFRYIYLITSKYLISNELVEVK